MLVKALDLFEQKKGRDEGQLAIDLGCGSGADTFELLRRGWKVLAIDNQPYAIVRLKSGVPPEQQARLETQVAAFETIELPQADLINASYSLPFCSPQHFDLFWQRIVESLQVGGRFAGCFFGDRDEWVTKPGMTFHTGHQVKVLLSKFETEFFGEEERDGTTAVGQKKHWHVFSVVARRVRS
jgi:SAM-dependent methyltransferase